MSRKSIRLPLHKRWQYRFARAGDVLLSAPIVRSSAISYFRIGFNDWRMGQGETYIWLEAKRISGQDGLYSIKKYAADTALDGSLGETWSHPYKDTPANARNPAGPFTRAETLDILKNWPCRSADRRYGVSIASTPFPSYAQRLRVISVTQKKQAPTFK